MMQTTYLDTDWVFQPLLREKLIMVFSLTRPDTNTTSPKIKKVKITWREA